MNRFSSTEPRRYLIAIGSSSCRKMGLPDLKHIEADIQKVTDLFKAQGYERVLSDQIDLDDTSQRIKSAISGWFASSERRVSDCVVVYYGGHGDEGGRFGHHYLFTFESTENRIGETAIKTKDFVESFFQGDPNSSPQNVLLILDTCYANVGGRQSSQVTSELVNDLQGSGLWIISSARSRDEAGDGVFVEALCAVMHPDREEFQRDGEFISIGDLMERINEHFKKMGQPQSTIANAIGIQQATIFIRNPRFITSNDSRPQAIQGQGILSEVIQRLWLLDYESQTRMFKDYTPRSRRVAAFVVQARDARIQHWLVKRLFNQLPNVRNARVFPFVIPAHPMWKTHNFDELWIDLAKQLECEVKPTTVLDQLVQVYQTKPVILTMYDWPASRRSQALQAQVLTDFWQPLVQKVKDLPNPPERSRLILFLAEGATKAPEVSDNSNLPIRLAPLTEITRDEVADWLDSQLVAPVLRQVRSEDAIAILIEQEIEEWDADPVQTLQQICYVFALENGIADIESEWRLVG